MADTKISAETPAGTLDGTEIVPVVKAGANARTTTQAIADRGAGGGLWSQVRSATPTAANTGLSTWVNQGSATVADGATGILIASPASNAANIHARTVAAPAAPYTLKALIASGIPFLSFYGSGIGWYDGTNKLHLLVLALSTNELYAVQKYSTPTSFNANDTTQLQPGLLVVPQWLYLVDDGTNVKFGYSQDGNPTNAQILFSVAKASGWLGASGYTNLAFFLNPQSNAALTPAKVTALSWAVSSGAAF